MPMWRLCDHLHQMRPPTLVSDHGRSALPQQAGFCRKLAVVPRSYRMTQQAHAQTADVLLTVSGIIDSRAPAAARIGRGPRIDYHELAHGLNADLIDLAAARRINGSYARMLERLGGPALNLAWAASRLAPHYRTILTDGEQVGLPLAALLRRYPRHRPYHVMITHAISRLKKAFLIDTLRLHDAIDRYLVYASIQQRFLQTRWKLPAERVIQLPFMVDAAFFHPDQVRPVPLARPQIFSLGREARDYPTLIRAVCGLDADLLIAAYSPWSKRGDSSARIQLPPNVRRGKYNFHELRAIYSASSFVVIPLYPVDFQAGITSILEAMAMGKAVICSRAPGQTDAVVDGETGLYVPPEDPRSLRAAIQYLLDHPEVAEQMGRAGRRRVEQGMTIEHYVARLSTVVGEAQQWPPAPVSGDIASRPRR